MKKDEFNELMLLSLYGELSETDQAKFETMLKKHPERRKDFLEAEKFKTFVTEHSSSKMSDQLLVDARVQLRNALRKERNAASMIESIRNMLKEFTLLKSVVSGAGILSLGMLIGYFIFSPATVNNGIVLQPVSSVTGENQRTTIANIRFIDSDAADGEVEFEFDAVAPMHVKGKIDDPEIQKLLTHALLNESNAGIRLSTVNAIRNHTENSKTVDPAIKSALITSLKSDANPGVRSEALRVLQQYTFDNDIRDAFLFVIAKDANSGIRVSAINALQFAKMDGTKFDDKTVNALKQQIEKEQNNYIRNRAVNLVKEIYQ